MSSTIETGHAKNVANFQNLITIIKSFGDSYNPAKESLSITKLETLAKDSQSILEDIINKNAVYNRKINERQEAFSDLKTLSTRVLNALLSTDASKNTIEDAKGFNRKIQGQRSKTNSTVPTDPDAEAPKTISTSQQSFTQQIQHLTGLTAVLKNEPLYKPNEKELSVKGLETKQTTLAPTNDEVEKAHAEVTKARLKRNATFYTNADSIYELSMDIKKYIKSIYGATSPEYGQVKSIEIKSIKS